MTKDEIIKKLRDMAKYPTVTLPRDCEALKAAADLLAQPEQEPVAWLSKGGKGIWFHEPDANLNATPLYITPPQPEPVIDKSAAERIATALRWEPKRKPLTIVELQKHWQVAKVLDMTDSEISFPDYVLITKDVEALHGIKGQA